MRGGQIDTCHHVRYSSLRRYAHVYSTLISINQFPLNGTREKLHPKSFRSLSLTVEVHREDGETHNICDEHSWTGIFVEGHLSDDLAAHADKKNKPRRRLEEEQSTILVARRRADSGGCGTVHNEAAKQDLYKRAIGEQGGNYKRAIREQGATIVSSTGMISLAPISRRCLERPQLKKRSISFKCLSALT